MSAASHDDPGFAAAVGIVGVGLIGGSLAAALKKRGYPGRVLGGGRNSQRLEQARTRGLIDAAADPRTLAETCDLIVVCTPVDRIVDDVRALAPHARPGTLLTDAGSTKREICRALAAGLPRGVTFVGSHPLAGSEKQGFEHADPELFGDRTCIVTAEGSASAEARDRLRRFWEYVGARVVEMPADQHDRILAQTSHVPHAAAAALALTLDDAHGALAASGFRDTTRIAAGDPALWAAILLSNADEIADGMSVLEGRLAELRRAIAERDAPALKKLLELAKRKRDAL